MATRVSQTAESLRQSISEVSGLITTQAEICNQTRMQVTEGELALQHNDKIFRLLEGERARLQELLIARESQEADGEAVVGDARNGGAL